MSAAPRTPRRLRHSLARLTLAGILGAASTIPAQVAMLPGSSTLPATSPTANGAAPLSATPDGAVARRLQKAQVTFADGLLDVRANNSSLNSILREIARTTGMKLTGSVADQRVFGNYGPATPATVLATLLDGTGSNMLLRGEASAPEELVLTPRNGGPSPPSAPSADEDDSTPAQTPAGLGSSETPSFGRHSLLGAGQPRINGPSNGQNLGGTNGLSGPRSIDQPINNIQGSSSNVAPTPTSFPADPSVAVDAIPTPSSALPASTGAVDAPNPPPPGTTTSPFPSTLPPPPQSMGSSPVNGSTTIQNGASPDGTSATGTGAATTPEQVFQLLQQLRQQSVQQNGKQQ